MVGEGNYIGGIIMSHNFQYISKHDEKVVSAYNNLIKILKNVQNEIRDKFTFQYKIVGSYSRNMITYDSKSNIGFDLDVNIYPNDDFNEYSPQEIKTTLIKAFRKYLKKYKYSKLENSTRVITIKVNDTKNSKIIHSIDFAIVHDYEDEEGYQCQEFIRFNKKHNSYTWEEQDDGFYMLDEKIKWIKDEDLWQELREMYLKRKNSNNDINKKSRSLFAESVNNICNEYGYFE
ncbi:hypothetical protein [Parabacteroides goldsteinii]|uniref:hypothetical protein n=1 Tax=Parabacteroides goldsteinii TaxID=328812 RepID=UPI00259BBCEC|nr:hypothetical protein [Parabacteroides goldsteinii]